MKRLIILVIFALSFFPAVTAQASESDKEVVNNIQDINNLTEEQVQAVINCVYYGYTDVDYKGIDLSGYTSNYINIIFMAGSKRTTILSERANITLPSKPKTGNVGYFTSYSNSVNTALEELQQLITSGATPESTFYARITYLKAVMQTTSSVSIAEDLVITEKFREPSIYELSTLRMASTDDAAKAYMLLLSVLSELSTYQEELLPVLVTGLSGTLSTIGDSVLKIEAIKKGVDLLSDQSVLELWNQVTESGESLNSVYQRLVLLDAFNAATEYIDASTEKPLNIFFDYDNKLLSDMLLIGINESATYLSMQTNLYDPYSLKTVNNEEFINNFHYTYGFHRKALLMDTNADAPTTLYTTGIKGTTKVATLSDIINSDGEVVLYIDSGFYNAQEVVDTFDVLMQDEMSSNSESLSKWSSVLNYDWSKITTYMKIGTDTVYNVDKLNKLNDWRNKTFTASTDSSNILSVLFIDTVNILDLLADTDYSALQSYAVVSAIYNDNNILVSENALCTNNAPVFIASEKLALVNGISGYYKNSIYNYALLKNVNSELPIGYKTSLDMSSPLYMDIYGNIVTESGYIVIPAASNATLHTADYSPYTAAFLASYGKDYSIPTTITGLSDLLLENDDIYVLKNAVIQGTTTNVGNLSTSSSEALSNIKTAYVSLNDKYYDVHQHLALEVLRGAPIDYIDKEIEQLNIESSETTAGLVTAAKYDGITESLKTKSIVAIPNLSFLDNIQWIIYLGFKLLMIITIVVICIVIYTDATGGRFSLRTAWKCCTIPFIVLLAVVTIPLIFELTYYQSNKLLLQKETEYIAMLNLEKRTNGLEIGVYAVEEPKIDTDIYLKLEDKDVSWSDIFYRTIFTNTFEDYNEVYEEYLHNTFLDSYQFLNVQNDGVYISLDTLFDSSDIVFSTSFKSLYQVVTEEPVASFYSPYYAFLDLLLENVTAYNQENDIYAYSTAFSRGGALQTIGLITPYFSSNEFMENTGDLFNLNIIYNLPTQLIQETNFSEAELDTMRESQWYNNNLSVEEIEARITKMTEYAQEFIVDNHELLGRVTDETFLKIMALSISMYHNKIFGVESCSAFEVRNLSTEDLMRLSMASKEDVLFNTPLSFSRYTLDIGGTPALYSAAVLHTITWIGSIVKPVCIVLSFLAIFVSLFVFKIVLRKKSKSIIGYLYTVIVLSATNLLHAVILKSTLYLPSLHITGTASILIQVGLQLVYMLILIKATYYALRDFRDLGANEYQADLLRIKQLFNKEAALKDQDNWDLYHRLIDDQENRTHK